MKTFYPLATIVIKLSQLENYCFRKRKVSSNSHQWEIFQLLGFFPSFLFCLLQIFRYVSFSIFSRFHRFQMPPCCRFLLSIGWKKTVLMKDSETWSWTGGLSFLLNWEVNEGNVAQFIILWLRWPLMGVHPL